jgi:hypothetical protein
MPASVILAEVSIKLMRPDPVTKKVLYGGSASYRVVSDSIDFKYECTFARAESVATAVIEGAAQLRGELDALSLATQNIQTGLSIP